MILTLRSPPKAGVSKGEASGLMVRDAPAALLTMRGEIAACLFSACVSSMVMATQAASQAGGT
ncbi:protein of unknown function [Bradyrhizobium sp. ORS 285]|nr:hypothetical protein BRAO285_2890030 [Bradyrhizobium sp. ORS 285]SMX59691.1 protein of unknown function [Bradyrhizobium sp. ORS 285]